MSKNKQLEKAIKLNPIILVLILGLAIIMLSSILSLFQVEGPKATIVALQDSNLPYGVEMTVSTVKNALTKDGVVFLIQNAVNNMNIFKPLILLMIAVLGISIGEVSGLFYGWFNRFKKYKLGIIVFFTFFLGVILSYFGPEIYLLYLPLMGVFYKYIEKNPALGLYTAFLGISIGLGTSLLFDYSDHILGLTTQITANIERNNNFIYNIYSTVFIKFGSSIILSLMGSFIVLKILYPRLPKTKMELNEVGTKYIVPATITFVLLLLLVVYQIIPGLPLSGNLLDGKESKYLLQLMGENSLFKQSYIYIFTIIMMITGAVYGYLNKTFNSNFDYSKALTESFRKMWQVFILLFFVTQLIALFAWTNIGEVLATQIIDLLAILQFSGLLLILAFIVVVILIAIIVPYAEGNWKFVSPIAVPLFMRSNMTPDFTQFVFAISNGIGQTLSLVSINLYLLVGMLQKYSDDDITVFGTIKTMFLSITLLVGVWLIIIISWYIIGLPLGIETFATI